MLPTNSLHMHKLLRIRQEGMGRVKVYAVHGRPTHGSRTPLTRLNGLSLHRRQGTLHHADTVYHSDLFTFLSVPRPPHLTYPTHHPVLLAWRSSLEDQVLDCLRIKPLAQQLELTRSKRH
eukprot:scaffold99511_cov17-Tisochrysis_lutea.AAC.1